MFNIRNDTHAHLFLLETEIKHWRASKCNDYVKQTWCGSFVNFYNLLFEFRAI